MIDRLLRRRFSRGRGRHFRFARQLRYEPLEERQLLTAVGAPDDLPLLAPDLLLVPEVAPTAALPTSEPVAFGSPPPDGQAPYGATVADNSEYMLGDVWVNVVLLESDGSVDTETENWTQTEINAVKSEIAEGAQWWESLLPSGAHDLTFHLDFTYADDPVATRYEPITRSSADQELWIGDFLDAVDHDSGGSIFTDMWEWNYDTLVANQAHWSYTVFVVDSSSDPDGKFQNGGFGYAYLGGPFTVMTYDNDGWGIDRMSHVFAHETGHIFYALDEYPDSGSVYTSRAGYYNTQNLNAYDGHPDLDSRVNSMMAEASSQIRAWTQHTSSPSSLEMIGWKDSDGNGIFDVLDVPLTLTGSGHLDPVLGQYEFTGSSAVQALPNQNPYGASHAVTINTVDRLQYRLDGGNWIDGNQYHDYSVSIAQTVPVPSGSHTIDFRTVHDQTGVMSPVWSGSFVLNGVQVTESGGATVIREAGETDTYTLALGTTPASPIEITVTADAQSEVSSDGINYSSSVIVTRVDTSAQTITVRAVDDTLSEGAHTSRITHAITSSADPDYPTSLTVESVIASVMDDDALAVLVVESGGSTDISEEGTTDTYTIALETAPTGTLVIEVTAAEQSEVSINGTTFSSMVSFAPTDATPQTITVRAIDDSIVEGLHSSLITQAIVSSTDPNYPTSVAIAAVNAHITDNDAAGVMLTQSDGTTLVDELGMVDTYAIALATMPAGDVDIAITTDGQSEVSLDGTTFRPSVTVSLSDLTPRTITVRGTDDPYAEGPHESLITHEVTSADDPVYESLAIASITVSIVDDDIAGITIAESDGSTNVSEAGGIDSYTVNLDTPPAETIVFGVSADAQAEVSLDGTLFRSYVSFSRDSMTPQTIWVRAVDDHANEGPHVGVVTHAVTYSTDPAYPSSLPIDDVVAQIADNDVAGVTVIESGGTTDIDEVGTLDTYTLALDSTPASAVEITVGAESQAEVSLNGTTFGSSVSFTRSDTSPQVITVRGVDDLVDEGTHAAEISHAITASSDPNYPTTLPIAGLTATITDDDTAGLTVTETEGSTRVSEAGALDQYDIALDTVPLGMIELTVTADAQTEVSFDGATFSSSLSFTRSDTTAQTVIVRAVDDSDNEGDHTGQLTQAITSSADPNYPTTAVLPAVVAQIEDDDQAGIEIVESDGATTLLESGGADTYTISLDSPPDGTVEIRAIADGQSEVSLDGTTFGESVTFLRDDMTAQTIYVRAIDDVAMEGAHASTISHTIVTSSAANYPTQLPLPSIQARVVDNELGSVTVLESAGSTLLMEAGTGDSYTIALDVPPEAAVEITVTGDPQSEVSLDGTAYSTSVSFSRGDTAPQTIVVRAVDDLVDEGPHTSSMTHAITASTDPNFPTTLAILGVVADIADNDTAGITVTETAGDTAIGEAGQTDSYTIALDTVPEGSVEMTVTADDQSEVSLDGSTFSPMVSFTRTSTAAQTITVRAIDDAEGEGPHTSIIKHAVTASTDANYPTDLAIASVTADVVDNETIGVRIKESDGSTVLSEVGTTDTYTITLDAAPTGTVVINVVADGQTQVSSNGTTFLHSLSFTRTNTAAQTITVRAVDDAAMEGPHVGRIRHSISFSADPTFPAGMAIPDVMARITDDEVAGVLVSESDASTDVTEAGAVDTFTLSLDTVPDGFVELTVTTDGLTEVSLDGTSFATSVQILPTDTTAQTVTVRAVDNLAIDGPRISLVTSAVTSSNDPRFPTNLPIADVGVNVTDNDVAGITLEESDGVTAIGEGGATDSYTVALDTLPAADVEITVMADSQSEVSLDGITFGSTFSFVRDDASPQTITVRAVDDNVTEGDHAATITHAITVSADPDYPVTRPIPNVVATVADNDLLLLGDANGDGQVNGLDVEPFVGVLLNGPYDPAADMNEDGDVNGLDVDLFVQAVVGGSPPVAATSTEVGDTMVTPPPPAFQQAAALPLRRRHDADRNVVRHTPTDRAAAPVHTAPTARQLAVDHALTDDVDWTVSSGRNGRPLRMG